MFSNDQLETIFNLLDRNGRGCISLPDLVAASAAHPGAKDILSALTIQPGQQWDFKEFTRNVEAAFGGGQGDTEETPGKRNTRRNCKRTSTVYKSSGESDATDSSPPPPSYSIAAQSQSSFDPLLQMMTSLKSTMEEIRLTQIDTRAELETAMESRFRRSTEEMRRCVHSAVEAALVGEGVDEVRREREEREKAVKELMRVQNELHCYQMKEQEQRAAEMEERLQRMTVSLRDANDEIDQLKVNVRTLESTVQSQEEVLQIAEDDVSILRERNLTLEAQVETLEQTLEGERAQYSEVKSANEGLTESLEEERAMLMLERLALSKEKELLIEERKSLQVDEEKKKSSSLQAEMDLAVEACEDDFQERERLTAENRRMQEELSEQTAENSELHSRVKSLQEVNSQSQGVLGRLLDALPLVGSRARRAPAATQHHPRTEPSWEMESGLGSEKGSLVEGTSL